MKSIKELNSQITALMEEAGGKAALIKKLADERAEHERRLNARWDLFWQWAWEARPELTEKVYKSSWGPDDVYIDVADRSPEDRLVWFEFEDLFYATSDKTLIAHHNLSYAREWDLDPDDPELWRKIRRRVAAMPAAKELGLTPEWAERDEAVCISL